MRINHLASSFLLCVTVAGTAPAQESRATDPDRQRWEFLRATYDADANGTIGRGEYPRSERAFRNLDRNRNGRIDAADFERRGRSGVRTREHNPAAALQAFFDLFGSFVDTDGTPGISSREWNHAVETVTPRELSVRFREFLALAGPAGDGETATRAGRHIAGRLRALDVNRDGGVSAEELHLAFSIVDRDQNGALAAGDEVVLPPGVGTVAPDFDLVRAEDADERVKLSSFRGDRPVALIFGSYTCPAFRQAAVQLTKLSEAYGDRVAFFLVYVREAHAIDSETPSAFGGEEGGELIEDPLDLGERASVAARCVEELELPIAALLDDMEDTVSEAYRAWPDRLYLIDVDGKVAYAGGCGPFFFSPAELEAAIRRIVGRRRGADAGK